jgi:hypothetical protein
MINYYAPVIFQKSMNLSRDSSLILGGAAQCTYLLGSMIPILTMDRYGCRILLIACSAGLSFCFVMVTIMLSLGTTASAYGATAFIFLFQLVRGIGWLPVSTFHHVKRCSNRFAQTDKVPRFYPSELATTRIRSEMQPIASAWRFTVYWTQCCIR